MTTGPGRPERAEGDSDETELPTEVPEADAVEQRRPLREGDEEQAEEGAGGEVDEADAAEQARAVPADDDEYR
ncbi:hypothetical protein [Streptomyces tsukubensis]|uniref:Uncharacterized protein n=1 Tax=Streptomyces tsukubensis TaxID=83656 RepID=A0A1V4AC64_9ACTN|nr:hypothetical protein [Streptomyces tsukubensis]OON81284.1 hypothetical protein B1H18_07970 [Streptomyces tsukubensis]QFR95603.1 hypothetical protein GBW32_24475 [Streptomyces tsukubensis]